MTNDGISPGFLKHAADILADTEHGLTGSVIVRITAAHAAEHDVDLPHPVYPFEAPNKRTALYENLLACPAPVQYRILREMCEDRSLQARREVRQLRSTLVSRYGHLNSEGLSEVDDALVDETRHWLQHYPDVRTLYESALEKYEQGLYLRNVLDDLRLALEKLLQAILRNSTRLEKQGPEVGRLIREQGGSKEFVNMVVKLLDYYAKYQNEHIKHDDAVIEEEVAFILEMTSALMKHVVRLAPDS